MSIRWWLFSPCFVHLWTTQPLPPPSPHLLLSHKGISGNLITVCIDQLPISEHSLYFLQRFLSSQELLQHRSLYHGKVSPFSPRLRLQTTSLTRGLQVLDTAAPLQLWLGIAEVSFFDRRRRKGALITLKANCNANSGFEPVASGGDGDSVQYWFVGYDAAFKEVIVSHQGTNPNDL